MFFHWLSLSNGLILDLDDSYNTVFKADKPVEPVCGLKQCYVDTVSGTSKNKSGEKRSISIEK